MFVITNIPVIFVQQFETKFNILTFKNDLNGVLFGPDN